jgi:hypothetical protein
MKLFNCIVDDGKNVFKTLTASKSKKDLLNVYGGNGEFIKIQDVTSEYFNEDTVAYLENVLKLHFGEGETKLICALVEEHIKNK